MIRHSIYTSAYNLNKMGFDWSATLTNWHRFLNGTGQIVIAVNTSEDDTYQRLLEYAVFLSNMQDGVEWTIFETAIPYDNPLFDGMVKNEALKRCTGEYCTLLDMDEVLPLSARAGWESAKQMLARSPHDALFLPVIDLYHDERHYKNLGIKWYLHKNLSYLKRGRVNFAARADGTTDIERSDTCELITEDGNLANSAAFVGGPSQWWLPGMAQGICPYVVHTGWLSREQRLRQSAFWAPVWSARDGTKVEKALTGEDLDKIPYYPHNLPHWNNES